MTGVAALMLVGVVMALSVFLGALRMPASAGVDLPALNIARLAPGEVLRMQYGDENWGGEYLVIKGYDEQLRAYNVYKSHGKVVLPERTWWRWGGECENFGPEMLGAKIKPNGEIKCHDENYADRPELRWSLDGENLGSYTEDMTRVSYVREGGYIVFGKSKE